MSSDFFSPGLPPTEDWVTALNLDILRLREQVEMILERLAKERELKYAELQKLLAAGNGPEKMPTGVMIASLLASLRRAYNADQLLKAHSQLTDVQKTVEKLDDLPYVWKRGPAGLEYH